MSGRHAESVTVRDRHRAERRRRSGRTAVMLFALLVAQGVPGSRLLAQGPSLRFGEKVSTEVEVIYQRGLEYLARTQTDYGSWGGAGRSGGEHGITGMCVMAFLASGEDPNFGRYSSNIRRALRSMILGQDPQTGYLGNSMYHHGFAMLGLAEAYGTVDDSQLWDGSEPAANRRTIGEALDLAVRRAVTSQKRNQWGAWRYSPESTDADTSVAGAVTMGLLAARNAGIEVPDESLDKALNYFKSHTADGGSVAYSGGVGGGSENMTCIAALVYSIGRKRDWPQFKATVGNLSRNLQGGSAGSYEFYNRYYKAQALFQGNFEGWARWNAATIQLLKARQQADGSFDASHGKAYGTSMSLLALALNYRFLPIYER